MISNTAVKIAGLWLLMMMAAFSAAYAGASASNDALNARITGLERITNSHSQLLQQLQQQLTDNQNDIDSLRGQIQQNTYQLQQVVERQKQILLQMDALNSKQSSNNPTDTESAKKDASTTNMAPSAATTDNTLTSEPSDPPFAPRERGVQSDQANMDYNTAIDLILFKKQYDKAIVSLESWIKKYPDSTYQPNANYWLGQLYYNKHKYDNAAYFFATVVQKYPKSPKAPGALLKVGIIMQEQNKSDKAIEVFKQVMSRYPDTDAAKKAATNLANSGH